MHLDFKKSICVMLCICHSIHPFIHPFDPFALCEAILIPIYHLFFKPLPFLNVQFCSSLFFKPSTSSIGFFRKLPSNILLSLVRPSFMSYAFPFIIFLLPLIEKEEQWLKAIDFFFLHKIKTDAWGREFLLSPCQTSVDFYFSHLHLLVFKLVVFF